jgi:hypothetical protein
MEVLRYQLVPTENVSTFLQLDTETGRTWQVRFAVGEGQAGRWSIVEDPLVIPEEGRAGRFAIYGTQNVYNFLLLDTEDGRIWDRSR